MKFKCIIVDDEPLAIKAIQKLIEKLNDLEVVATCEDAIAANTCLKKFHIDLMFLDIQMPEVTGINFLKSLKNPPKVIFTTAFRNYAVEAFELDVVDYLIKPISMERFLKAINKFYYGIDTKPELQKIQDSVSEKAFLYVRAEKMIHKILLEDILYVENIREYLQIFTKEKKYITKMSISALEKNLPSDRFIRTHRSYIVSIQKISSFSSTIIKIDNNQIPISRNYKMNVLKSLNYNLD